MEIICAGYPKTGSKSCTAALEELGVKVCDAMAKWEKFSHLPAKRINTIQKFYFTFIKFKRKFS